MNGEPKQIISFGKFELDAARRSLFCEGKRLHLNAKAFDLLVYMAENAGRIVTKNEILDAVWENQFVEEANLKVQISALRKVLGEQKDEHRFLVTIPGKGYKFIAEIGENDREIVIESRRFSRLVVEETEEKIEETKFRLSNIFRSQKLGVGAFFILLATAFGVYQYFSLRKANIPFEKIKFTRLTNSGNVSNSAISPDGKYIAYTLRENEGNSIWIQQVGTASNIRLLQAVKAEVYELTFTPDGSRVYYSLFADGDADLKLFRVSSLGGISEQIHNFKASYITFAPDGKRFAYAQSDSAAGQNYLMIADADGGNQQKITAKNYPNTFVPDYPVVAWSPDGETIACLVRHAEGDFSLIGINPKDGSEKVLSADNWFNVWGLEWAKDGSGILISAADNHSENFQVYFVSYPNGEKRQITNDLNQYNSLSTTANGQSFITLQTTSTNSIFVGNAGADADQFVEIVSETGGLNPINWTPDGKIIFRSNKDSVSNLWTMDADGGNRRQLTINAQVNGQNMCLSPDGRYIVFESWRSGNANLWRVDADGGKLTQLTNGKEDFFPSCSPDNRTIVYQKGLSSSPTLWKVNLEGGEPVQLTDSFAKWNAVSNDNRRISYFYMDQDKWRIGIIPSEGSAILQSVEVPDNLQGNLTRWLPDNQSLAYISTVGNVGNIGILPLDGSESKLLTNFKSHSLESYAWSPDRQKLAVVRGTSISNVVLVTNDILP